jgi:hypothetical protein
MGLASFFGKDWTVARNRGLRFVARHPILSEIADQLASYDLGDLAEKRATIYVGAHSFTKRVLPPGFKIGLQTEHFFDENGLTLWGLPSRAAILRRALQYDVLLDLSPLNAPAYAFLPAVLRRRLRFGPHLFPDVLPDYHPAEGDLLFFGATNDRRADLLARIAVQHPLRNLPYGTHGTALLAEIARAHGVLNLHFSEGIYTEYPRLLTAALSGKVVWSDRLAAPLLAGRHYVALDQQPDQAELAAIYRRFCDEFAARHRFSLALREALAVR